MADALTAGQQRIGELGGIKVKIAFNLFEPFQTVAGGGLQAQHLDPALGLIAVKRPFQRRFAVQIFRQRNRTVKRQPRAGADREMPGRRRIAHQHDVLVIPFLADHPGKLHPHRRTAQMHRIRHQIVTAQMAGKDPGAGCHGFFLGHRGKTQPVPGLGQGLNNEGRGLVVELVNMGPDPAMLRPLKDKGKGVVEFLMRAQPDELALAGVDIGLEYIGIFAAYQRVDAIGGDHQIIILAVVFGGPKLGLEPQIDPQVTRPRLQQDQHLLAPDPGKAMSARHRPHPVMDHRDIIPIGKVAADRFGADRIVHLHPAQRIVRQHHAPAKGVVGLVPLHHRHLMRRVAQLHRDGEIKTGRATAKAKYLHPPNPPSDQLCVLENAGTGVNSFQASNF